MIEDMTARKLCAATQSGHISSCKRFAAFLKRSPDPTTCEDIRSFQLHLADTRISICNRNRIMTGLPVSVPRGLLAVASTVKTRVLLSFGYGCGLRASRDRAAEG